MTEVIIPCIQNTVEMWGQIIILILCYVSSRLV